MISISYAFRLGKITVSHIINETCESIWRNLRSKRFPRPTEENWKKIATQFEALLQLPLCVGAVDGKHITMQAPPNSGSQFYNYKGSLSIILKALCNATYKFIAVDIGDQGRQSDGGVFRNSEFGRRLLNDELNLPTPETLELGENLTHYYVVGDSAFPLTKNIMRPYAGRYLPQYKRIFNYRLSRARCVSENAFCILALTWRILRKLIIASLNTVESITQAAAILHNWLMNKNCDQYCPQSFIHKEDCDGNVTDGRWRQEASQSNLVAIGRVGTNTYKQTAEQLREDVAFYFYSEGAVRFQ